MDVHVFNRSSNFFLLTGLHTCSYCIFNLHVSSIADSIDVLHLFPDYFQTSWAQYDMKTDQLVVWDISPIQDGETQQAEAELFHQVMRYCKRGHSWLQLSPTKWFARFYQHFRPMWYHKFLIVSYIDVLPRFFLTRLFSKNPPDFILENPNFPAPAES